MMFETALIALSLMIILHSKIEFKMWPSFGLYDTVAPRSELLYNGVCKERENNPIVHRPKYLRLFCQTCLFHLSY